MGPFDRYIIEKEIAKIWKKIGCLNCCNTSYGLTTLSPPVDAPGTGDPVVLFNTITGTLYYWDGSTWEVHGSALYTELTYAEAQEIQTSQEVVPGMLYKITDKGDRGIFLHGITSNKFSTDGYRLMLIPATYESGATVTYGGSTYTSSSMFSPYRAATSAYLPDDFVIYNGHFWRCDSPVPTSSGILDSTAIQTIIGTGFADWARIEKTDPDASLLYIEKLFKIKYDFNNDWIFEQSDNHNNVVGISYAEYLIYNASGIVLENPVNYTDWGLADFKASEGGIYSTVSNNKCPLGFYNNAQETFNQDYYIESNNCAAIVHNYCAGGTLVINNNISTTTGAIIGSPYYGAVLNNINYSSDIDIRGNIFQYGIFSNVGFSVLYNKEDLIHSNVNIGGGSIQYNVGHEIYQNSLEFGDIEANYVRVISNITSEEGIYRNFGDTLSNTTSGNRLENNVFIEINNNPLTGGINNNRVQYIRNNSCRYIGNNVCNSITDNDSGIQDIQNNRNNGDISNGSSSGGGPWDIYNNINNGDISGPRGASVSDATVNK